MGKLYKVKIEVDIMVMADSEKSAIDIAKKNAPNEVGVYGSGSAHPVKHIAEIPDDWINVIPYGQEGTKKCLELVSAVNELPKDDVEEILRVKNSAKAFIAEPVIDVKPETRLDPKPKELDWHETKSGRPMPSLRFVR